jgi:hypothetical protein
VEQRSARESLDAQREALARQKAAAEARAAALAQELSETEAKLEEARSAPKVRRDTAPGTLSLPRQATLSAAQTVTCKRNFALQARIWSWRRGLSA